MSDDCMSAHQVISLAYDGEPVSAQELQAAKAHCAGCTSCTAFVSGLARLRSVPAPTATPAAVERTLAAVRDARSHVATQPSLAARTADAETTRAGAGVPSRVPARWAPWTGWATAAAAVLLVVGVVTWQGVAYLTAPRGDVAYVTTDGQVTGVQEYALTPGADVAAESPGTTEGSKDTYRLTRASAPAYVVFGGFVFAVADDDERIPSQARILETVITDLGTGTPTQKQVYEGEEAGQILIAVDERTARLAQLVVREYDGRWYGLQSPDITVFGTWPSLPGSLPQPSSMEGSPEYDDAGEDADRVTVYTRSSGDPAAGFAVAPDTRADDPAAANPNWTWWSPLR